MSEEAKEAPKKKGKLPVVVILALVLGAGGFFGMKMRGGDKDKEPEIKLGAVVPIEKEFIVNLKNGSSYVQAEIALHMKEGFDKKEIEHSMPALQDRINTVLMSKMPSEITAGKLPELKKEIATGLNEVLASGSHGDDKADHKDEKKKSKKKKSDEHDDGEHSEPEHPDWDSEKGPVLKVYFTKLATQ
ncbi:MAG TPA: flagellar basal body-associated FliL family protein [Fimbriimonadaceae bacterium]|nr:flagellar basal body-associated FliL family protein [Fimbriimonadaceae bacterium]